MGTSCNPASTSCCRQGASALCSSRRQPYSSTTLTSTAACFPPPFLLVSCNFSRKAWSRRDPRARSPCPRTLSRRDGRRCRPAGSRRRGRSWSERKSTPAPPGP